MVNLQIRSCLTLLRKTERKKLPVILKVRIRKWQTERGEGRRGEQGSPSEGTPGEAVLTNGDVTGVVAEAKVTREQVRAKNKETLLEIIDNTNLSDEQKQDAINQMIAMTELAEKEAAVETMLASKGFSDTVVSLTADVVVNSAELTDANRAQIEDIITRKAEIAPENIVITPIYSKDSAQKETEKNSENE